MRHALARVATFTAKGMDHIRSAKTTLATINHRIDFKVATIAKTVR